MVLQGINGTLSPMVSPRTLSLVRSCISSILCFTLDSRTQGQLYADDMQSYIHCRPANAALAVGEMGRALVRLETWMSYNGLRLYSDSPQFYDC